MEPISLVKQMVDFNKATFDNSFSAMVLLQEQTEKMVSNFLEQANWLPEDGKKVLNEWVSSYKKGREDFKKSIDESFHKVETYFNETAKAGKGEA